MKKHLSIYSFLLIAVTTLITACVKSITDTTPKSNDFSNSARVQVVNATVGAARNFVYVDGAIINGAALAYTGVFPVSPNTSFSTTAGFKAFLIRDTSSTILNQPPLSFAQNFQGGNFYTIFMYDTLNSPKQKTVLNNFEFPTDGTARLRFANFPYSPTAIPNVDVYSKRKGVNIFTNIAVTEVTPFIPYTAGLPDTFLIRPAGTSVNLQNYTPPVPPSMVPTFFDINATLTPVAGRGYTLLFRGGYRTQVSTAASVRTLTTFINY